MPLALVLFVGAQVSACNEQLVDDSEESGLPPEVERYIEARCERMLNCDCDTLSFDSQDTCFDDLLVVYACDSARLRAF